jgi:hypothetical protein
MPTRRHVLVLASTLAAALLSGGTRAQQPTYDVLITGGAVYDGSGGARFAPTSG